MFLPNQPNHTDRRWIHHVDCCLAHSLASHKMGAEHMEQLDIPYILSTDLLLITFKLFYIVSALINCKPQNDNCD